MKSINNLNDALIYLLKELHDGEAVLQQAIPSCSKNVMSDTLKNELNRYKEDSVDKVLKLERVFNYLMDQPTGKRNAVMRRMINDTHNMLDTTSSAEVKDIILASCIQSINCYKIAGLRTAIAFAIELQLETVPDLLQDILEAEKQTSYAMNKITRTALYQSIKE